ncbi:hypothetical protein MRB53_023755 [Persea americana]|uniref:Uncharacterized protein n=1 Tax=Persea americana TaxID=3435 RepID=A0ACC2LA91_PERAE|nr:hypothetical protein MRB53_023755 [Persea americana]
MLGVAAKTKPYEMVSICRQPNDQADEQACIRRTPSEGDGGPPDKGKEVFMEIADVHQEGNLVIMVAEGTLKRTFKDTLCPSSTARQSNCKWLSGIRYIEKDVDRTEERPIVYLDEWLSGIRYIEKDVDRTKERPIVYLDECLLQKSRRKREKSIIGQLFGQGILVKVLQQRIQMIWCIQGEKEILELLLTFSQESDMLKARRWSSWSFAGRELLVTNWVPNFDPERVFIALFPIWVSYLDRVDRAL